MPNLFTFCRKCVLGYLAELLCQKVAPEPQQKDGKAQLHMQRKGHTTQVNTKVSLKIQIQVIVNYNRKICLFLESPLSQIGWLAKKISTDVCHIMNMIPHFKRLNTVFSSPTNPVNHCQTKQKSKIENSLFVKMKILAIWGQHDPFW